MVLNRRRRDFFQTDEFIDSFIKDGKIDKRRFKELLEALLFSNGIEDKAQILTAGTGKLATDQQVIDKANSSVFESLFVQPYQLGDVNAEDATIVVTEVIWNITDSVVAPDTSDKSKEYRKRYLAKTNPSTTPQFDKFLTTVGVTVYTLDGTAGMPNLIGRTIQLCTYGTQVMQDLTASPEITFVSGTGVLTFTFGMTDIGQVNLISTS